MLEERRIEWSEHITCCVWVERVSGEKGKAGDLISVVQDNRNHYHALR